MHRTLLFSLISSMTVLAAASQRQPVRRPLVFEPNQGQAPSHVKWIARGPGYQVFLTNDGVTMMVQESSGEAPKGGASLSWPPVERLRASFSKLKYSTVRMKLEGSRPWNDLTGLEPTGGVSNYLIGNDETHWRRGIPHYARVSAAGVYDGVDLIFYSNGANLEYDFVVKPGTDPGQIRLAFDGQERIRVDDKSGDLILMTAGGGEVRQVRPKVYQQEGDRRVEVAGGYQLVDRGHATFALANYDRRRSLVIDPTIAFVKAYGGSDQDSGAAIAVDSAGNAYVAGTTLSTDFPVNNASLQWDQPGSDAFYLKLSPTGNILYSTYLGGSGDDSGNGIGVDSTGVYILGATNSTNFPHQNSKRKTDLDVFVTKILPDGGGLLYTAMVGGSGTEYVGAMAVDPLTHFVYVTGQTFSADFPIINNSPYWHQPGPGGSGDAFVSELDASGNLYRSNLMGGSGGDGGLSIALDKDRKIWVSGYTCSKDFPVLNNPQPYPSFNCTNFVARWDVNMYSLLFSRFSDAGSAIAVDANDNAYVIGTISPVSYHIFGVPFPPATPGAFQQSLPFNVNEAGFIAKFAPDGTILKSTYLAGSTGNALLYGIALNTAGGVYVSGETDTTTFPGASGVIPNPKVGFFVQLSSDLSSLRYTRFLTSLANYITVLDTSPTVPRQIYVVGTVNTANPSAEAVLVTMELDDLDAVCWVCTHF